MSTFVQPYFLLLFCTSFFWNRQPVPKMPPVTDQQLLVEKATAHTDKITYVVDGTPVNAVLMGPAQAFIVDNQFVFGFTCHGKHLSVDNEDTLGLAAIIPYAFPAPVYYATMANSYGLNGCTYSCKKRYTPLVYFGAYAQSADTKLGSIFVKEFTLLHEDKLMNGSKIGTYRVMGTFDFKGAELLGATASERCDHETDRRMAADIYPWYDPTCIASEKKIITEGYFDVTVKMSF